MRIIGLTGGIGSGKTTVAGMLRRRGAAVLDADRIAAELCRPDGPCFHKIVKHFGEEIVRRGRLDRRRLADIIFTDEKQRRILENVIHPEVRRDMARRLAALQKKGQVKVAVLDVPLLFESGMDRMADLLVTVRATRSQQLARAMEQHGLSRREAMARMDSQMSLTEKMRLSDLTIDNTGSLEATRRQVAQIWQHHLTK